MEMWFNYFAREEDFPFFIQYGIHESYMFPHSHEDFCELEVIAAHFGEVFGLVKLPGLDGDIHGDGVFPDLQAILNGVICESGPDEDGGGLSDVISGNGVIPPNLICPGKFLPD